MSNSDLRVCGAGQGSAAQARWWSLGNLTCFQTAALALLVLAGSAALAADASNDAPVQTSVYLMLGKEAGTEVVSRDGDEWVVRYQYDDRGRGPDIEARWQLNEAGLPVHLSMTGVDYFKAAVDEQFAVGDGVAEWKNAAEQGSSAALDAFYWPVESPTFLLSTLAQALLKDADHSIGMLPSGTAVLQEAMRIPEPGSKPRQKRELVAYEISGLGFAPQVVWFDADGAYLGVADGWMSALPKGREEWLGALVAAQTLRERERASEWARAYTVHPKLPVLISGAHVYDPRTGEARDASVLVVGERIAAVGDEQSMQLPADFERVDAAGKFLMPGLWDNHVHLAAADGPLHLAAGVTSVRDMANDQDLLPDRVARMDKGEEIGPRVIMAGFMDGPGPFAGPTKVLVDTPEGVEQWVNWYADHGYAQIKVYSSLKPELVPLVARLAHARGLRLSGHVPAFMSAEQFIAAGADELQHLNFVFLNFLTAQAPDTRDMTRFTAIGQYADGIDPANEPERKFIASMASHRTVLDPTVNIFEGFFESKAGQIQPGYAELAARLPPLVSRGLKLGGLKPAPGDESHYERAFASMLRFLNALYLAGVPIVPGTDGMPGFALQRELELYAAAGIPNAEILRMATLGSAEVNRKSHELGLVAPGWLADFILIDGDPLHNISDIRKVRQVVKGGVWYDPQDLYPLVGVSPLP